jgi:hypothetical protein
MGDIIAEKVFKRPVFTWGENLPDSRAKYLSAVKAADQNNIEPLLSFARS